MKYGVAVLGHFICELIDAVKCAKCLQPKFVLIHGMKYKIKNAIKVQ